MKGPELNRREMLAAGMLAAASPALALQPGSESERLDRFFEQVWQRDVARSPAMQANLGLRSGRDRWPDVTEARAAEDAELVRGDLAALRRFDRAALTPEAELSYRLFEYDSEQALRAHRWRLNRYPVCQMRGPQRSIPQTLIDGHAIANREDADTYVARLHRVRPYMADIVARLELQARHGVRPPDFSYPLVIGNCENLLRGAPFDTSGSDSPILADFRTKVARLDLADGQKTALVRDAEAGLVEGFGPGFRQLIDHLREGERIVTRNDGVWHLPEGDEYYAAALQMETTLPVSADEVHRLGHEEVARIHGAMRALMPRLGVSGSLADLFAHARSSDDLYYPDTPEGKARYLAEMRAKIDEVMARLDEIMTRRPRAPLEVRPVEPWLEASAGTAGYFAPSADGSRPGILLVNMRAMRNLPVYELSALAYHEGVPGHHLERAVSRELTGLPRFRQFGGYTAFSEGWALYAEQLPMEMGLYADAWQEFGQLSMELMRAGRLVVDTGVHALRWSRERAVAWLDENTPANHDDNVTAVQRYIVTPGQACAYEMGKLRMMALRDRARTRLGAAYDIRRFNDTILGSGPLPLPILEENVDRWIARGAA
ncbi:DUF885 family protein [Sphingosinicella sp. CPCC 101087]|uniref:DUF885 domain-containing protein n=1 Tax=Sphingosinicella sp. CPCC 101087 TaxID=2497754 RepID=UPI00101D494D|nr:DUF885 domain-containing protein [Sphingosinicella sp. CPCC 101087]